MACKKASKARKDFKDVKMKRLDLLQREFNHILENVDGT